MDNLDIIYGVLYDLFNQRFSLGSSEDKYCNITFEDFRETICVHENFNCIILKQEHELHTPEKDLEKVLPSPLMNRMEKHILKLQSVCQGNS